MIDMNKLQTLQKGLDDFIINKKELQQRSQGPDFINNIWCAGFSELYEIENDINNPEEWIDFLHFVLSVANKLGIELKGRNVVAPNKNLHFVEDYHAYLKMCWTEAMDASKTYKHWSNKPMDFENTVWFLEAAVEILQEVFIFQFKADIETEYIKKWEINRKRQVNHY
jgi:dimeric dUTPase (all-alpha-NTP-PPase superfamily)